MMKKVILLIMTVFMVVNAMPQSKEFDTLYTRGSDIILVPVNKEDMQQIIKSDQYNGTHYPDAYVVVSALLVFFITYSFVSIKKGQNRLHKGFIDLSKRMDKVDKTLEDHTIIMSEISLCHNVMARIDYMIQLAIGSLPKNDNITGAFILKMAKHTRDSIDWAIRNKLKNLTEEEIRAHYELIAIDIREFMEDMPKQFVDIARPELVRINDHHIDRVITIAKDNIFNEKLNSFFTLTNQTVNEVIRIIVSTRLQTFKTK